MEFVIGQRQTMYSHALDKEVVYELVFIDVDDNGALSLCWKQVVK